MDKKGALKWLSQLGKGHAGVERSGDAGSKIVKEKSAERKKSKPVSETAEDDEDPFARGLSSLGFTGGNSKKDEESREVDASLIKNLNKDLKSVDSWEVRMELVGARGEGVGGGKQCKVMLYLISSSLTGSASFGSSASSSSDEVQTKKLLFESKYSGQVGRVAWKAPVIFELPGSHYELRLVLMRKNEEEPVGSVSLEASSWPRHPGRFSFDAWLPVVVRQPASSATSPRNQTTTSTSLSPEVSMHVRLYCKAVVQFKQGSHLYSLEQVRRALLSAPVNPIPNNRLLTSMTSRAWSMTGPAPKTSFVTIGRSGSDGGGGGGGGGGSRRRTVLGAQMRNTGYALATSPRSPSEKRGAIAPPSAVPSALQGGGGGGGMTRMPSAYLNPMLKDISPGVAVDSGYRLANTNAASDPPPSLTVSDSYKMDMASFGGEDGGSQYKAVEMPFEDDNVESPEFSPLNSPGRSPSLHEIASQQKEQHEDDVPSEDENETLNERFQSVLEHLQEKGSGNMEVDVKLALMSDLVEITEAFVSMALMYGRIIISEAFLPEERRTVKPIKKGGQLGGRKYIIRGVLFKFALDDNDVFSTNPDPRWACSKVAGHELKGLKAYQAAADNKLCFPLCCIVDYMGLRLVALSVLPIDKGTLAYGTADAGRTVLSDDEEIAKLVKDASVLMGLAAHKCGENQTFYSAVDLEGHRGRDGRFYMLDFSRSMPAAEIGEGGEHLYRLFRPEFLQIYRKPLSSDAFSRFQTNSEEAAVLNKDCMRASQFLRNVYVPVVTQQLLEEAESYDADRLDQMPMTTLLQGYGLNCRYLGLVLARLMGMLEESGAEGEDLSSSGTVGTSVAGMRKTSKDAAIESRIEARKASSDPRKSSSDSRKTSKTNVEDKSNNSLNLMQNLTRRLIDLCCVEIAARSIKNYLRGRLYEVAQGVSTTEEYLFKELCATLNTALTTDVYGRTFFEEKLNPLFGSQFFVDTAKISLFHVLNSVDFPLRWGGRCASFMILSRVKKRMGLQISKTNLDALRTNPALFSHDFLDRFDLESVKPRLKHSNIVEMAKATLFTWKVHGQLSEAASLRYMELAAKHWRNAAPSTATSCYQYAELLLKIWQTVTLLEGPAEYLSTLKAQAERYFSRAVALEPDNPYLYLRYARCLEMFKKAQEAEVRFVQALLFDPNDLNALQSYSLFLRDRGLEKAAEEFQLRFEQIQRLNA